MMKNAFYFILKLFSFSRYLNFCLDFLGMQKKRLDQKDKVDFEIYDVTAWLTKDYKTHISQDKFFCKSYAENEAGKLVPDPFFGS